MMRAYLIAFKKYRMNDGCPPNETASWGILKLMIFGSYKILARYNNTTKLKESSSNFLIKYFIKLLKKITHNTIIHVVCDIYLKTTNTAAYSWCSSLHSCAHTHTQGTSKRWGCMLSMNISEWRNKRESFENTQNSHLTTCVCRVKTNRSNIRKHFHSFFDVSHVIHYMLHNTIIITTIKILQLSFQC